MKWLILAVVVLFAACGKKKSDDSKRGDNAEARLMVRKIYMGAKAYWAEHAALPTGATAMTPGDAPWACPSGKHKPNPAMWTSEPLWDALRFTIDEPHWYSYSYESDGTSLKVVARGDLDCDNNPATYTLTAKVEGPDLAGGDIVEEQPLE